MSVVIVGGNECMTRQYSELCREYNFKAKVYQKMTAGGQESGFYGSAGAIHEHGVAQDGQMRSQ